jgi:hypothetical protein
VGPQGRGVTLAIGRIRMIDTGDSARAAFAKARPARLLHESFRDCEQVQFDRGGFVTVFEFPLA